MRQLQLSMAVGESLHTRHLSALSEEMTLRIAAPVFSRIRVPSGNSPGRTLTAKVMDTSLPVAATSAAMRRIGRQRGPLTQRIIAQGYTRSPDKTWVAHLNIGDSPPAAGPPITQQASLNGLPTLDSVVGAIWNSGFQIAAEGQPLPALPAVDPLPPSWDYPGLFRAAAAEHLSRIRPPVIPAITAHVTMGETASLVRAAMHPRVALANLRTCRGLDGRQCVTTDGAGGDSYWYGDGIDGAVVPAADVRAAQADIAGIVASWARHRTARYGSRTQDQPRICGILHDRTQF